MRLDELKKEMPETPEFIHAMIQQEVAKQLQTETGAEPAGRRRKINLRRVAAAAAVCIIGASTVAYAGTKLYHMYVEKKGTYSIKAGIGSQESKNPLPETIHDVKISAGYIPEGMKWSSETTLEAKDTPHQGGISISSVLMDRKDMGAAVTEKGVIDSEARTFGTHEGVYLRYSDLAKDKSMNQRIYLLCPEKYRVFTLYIGDDVPKKEAVKFAESLTFADKENLIKTKGLYTWSDLIRAESLSGTEDGNAEPAVALPVHKVGEVFTIQGEGEDNDGRAVTAEQIAVKVDSVQITDDLQPLDAKGIPDEWKNSTDSRGQLVENELSYVKSGDGVETLDQTVKKEQVKQKLVHVSVTYRNDTNKEIRHMLYHGSIMLMQHEKGRYQVYTAEGAVGKGFDYVMEQGAAQAGEMTWYSVKENYGNGGNYIPSLKPGESRSVEMAWIINENQLKDMYLNLSGSGSAYEIDAETAQKGVVYIGK